MQLQHPLINYNPRIFSKLKEKCPNDKSALAYPCLVEFKFGMCVIKDVSTKSLSPEDEITKPSHNAVFVSAPKIK